MRDFALIVRFMLRRILSAFKSKCNMCVLLLLLLFGFPIILRYFTSKPEDSQSYVPSVVNKPKFICVIDAGSSGSRIFVYERCSSKPYCYAFSYSDQGTLLSHKITPGLSSYSEMPRGALSHVMALLSWLDKHIKEDNKRKTSVYLLATAGMRLLPKINAQRIMDVLNKELPGMTAFSFKKAEIISGVDEGLYQWISSNYMSGLFPHTPFRYKSLLPSPVNGIIRTKGIIEVGGGSLQIAFETYTLGNKRFTYYNKIQSKDIDVSLYVNSLLGYGMNSVMKWYFTDDDVPLDHKVVCIPRNCKFRLEEDYPYDLIGVGQFEDCVVKLTEKLEERGLIYTDSVTKKKRLKGIEIDIPSNIEFEAYSEYYYTTYEVIGYTANWSSRQFFKENDVFCKREFLISVTMMNNGKFNTMDKDKLKMQCFKAAYLLVIGNILFGENHKLTPVFEHGGEEVQWTLGSLIYKDTKKTLF